MTAQGGYGAWCEKFIFVDIEDEPRAEIRKRREYVMSGTGSREALAATGRHANTLKIRPPLIFSMDSATRLLTETEAVVRSIR